MTERKPAITRKDLAIKLENCYKDVLPGNLARSFVNNFFDTIRERLLEGETVKISSFGVFSVVDKKARPGRNVTTGEYVEVSARRVVRFKCSKKLRTATGRYQAE